MTRILIADMDGTVIDSMDFLKELAVELVGNDGHSKRMMREVYEETFGKPIAEQFHIFDRSSCFKEPVQVEKLTALYESIHKLAAQHFPFTKFGWALYDQDWKKSPDWKLVLVSSTGREIIDTMSRIRFIPWDIILGRTTFHPTKQHQILHAVAQLGTLQDCVYVGDAPSDKKLADDLGLPYFYPHANILPEILNHAFPLAALPKIHPVGESRRRT